jgi:hypothetical protein
VTADAFALLLLNGCLLAAGLGVTAACGWWRGRQSLVASLGIAYLAGVAAYGVVAQLLLVLGASLARWQVVAVCAALAATGLLGRGVTRVASTGRTPLALPAAAMLAVLAVDLWFQPLWSYDSWTFWTPKAHALSSLGGLDAGWFTQSDLISPDYPLLLPAIEAAGFRFTGYETTLLDLQSWLFAVAFVAAVAGVAAGRARPLAIWVPLTMVAFAPAVADQLAAAEADLPVATLFAASGLCAYLWLTERSAPALGVAGVLAAGTVATKVEGLIFVVALLLVLVPLVWRRSRRDGALTLGVGAAAVVAGLAPWRIWLAMHDVANQASIGRVTDLGVLWGQVDRVPEAVGYLAWKAVDPTRWLLIVPLAAVGIFLTWRRTSVGAAIFAVAVGVVALCGLVLAYWTTPLDVEFHLATSARRVVTGPVLLWAALTPLLLDGER